MKKTYATSMPNHIGAFLKASKCFASLGINITRVSYDKTVDSHNQINYVLIAYIVNLAIVSLNIVIYFRNVSLDKKRLQELGA